MISEWQKLGGGTPIVRGELVAGRPCRAIAASCFCALTGVHNIHECSCGGRWTGSDSTGDFHAVRLPMIGGLLNPLEAIFGGPFG